MGRKDREKKEKKFFQLPEEKKFSQQSLLEKVCFFIVEWGTYLALFAPLIFLRGYFFPFVVPKTVFFRAVVDIIFIAYVLLAVFNPKYRPKLTLLTTAIAMFLGILVLASLTGVNFERSFWSVFERMVGLLTLFHLFAFYIVLTSCFKERKYWERILSVSILACLLVSFLLFASKDPIIRGGGTLGNSSFFSSYLLFNLFFAMILLVAKTGLWRIFYGAALVIFLAALFFNPGGFTKGAVAAFLIGMFILVLGSAVFYLFSSRKRKLISLILVSMVLLALGALWFSQLDFTKERAYRLWQSASVQSRLILWNMAWQGWQERFWLGWGLENFNIPFTKHFDPKLPLTQDIWYDRVHNVVLDVGIDSGIIGLLSYLSIFSVAAFGLLKLLPKITDKKNIIFPLGMMTLLLVYFLQNFFVFDMVSSYMMFFLSLAFISFLAFGETQENTTKKLSLLAPLVGSLLIILTIFAFYFGNIQPARASKFILKGVAYPLERSLFMFQKALETSPMTKFEAPEQVSRKITGLAFEPNQNRELLDQGFKLAEEEFKKSILQNPLDFRLQLFLGRHYNNFYQFTGDQTKLALAGKMLNEAVKLSQDNQQIYWTLAQTRLFQGNFNEALSLAEKAVDLEPRMIDSHLAVIQIAKITGDEELAKKKAEEALLINPSWEPKIKEILGN